MKEDIDLSAISSNPSITIVSSDINIIDAGGKVHRYCEDMDVTLYAVYSTTNSKGIRLLFQKAYDFTIGGGNSVRIERADRTLKSCCKY